MQQTGRYRQVLSVVAVTIFIVSMMYAGATIAIPKTSASIDTTSFSPYTLAQKQMPPPPPGGTTGTFVGWNKDSNSTSDEWTWENRNWLFGPKPTYDLYFENGTLIGKDDYVNVGEWFKIKVTIPLSIFSGNLTLASVEYNGWYMSSSPDYSASFYIRYGIDWNGDVVWDANTNIYNATEPESPPAPTFVTIDTTASSVIKDLQGYTVTFVAQFTSDAPLGMYSTDVYVMDNEWNGYSAGGGFGPWEFRGISVGVPPSQAMFSAFGGTYTVEKMDLDHNTIYSVSRLTDFIMRFNVTGDNVDVVRLILQLPDGMESVINVTGYYKEAVTTTGGWEYDPTFDTYVYNASAVVTTYVERYGVHEERQWVPFNTWREVNVTHLNWEYNEATGQDEPVIYNTTDWVPSMAYFTYNVTTGTFTEEYGYTVFGYPYDTFNPDLPYEIEMFISEPYPIDIPKFYELNNSLCNAYTDNGKLVVEFVGHFTEDMPVTVSNDMYYHETRFDSRVIGTDGFQFGPATYGPNPPQTESEFNLAHQIAIESPVTIAKLLLPDGKEPRGWIFQVDKNSDFMVYGELQGGSAIASDIDGVSFTLEAWDGRWSENESIWYTVFYEIYYELDGSYTLSAFNYTTKYNYTYGTYWDYVHTNKTGWHKEYNSTSGMMEYIYGEYWVWEYREVEGWYWATWYFNQQTGKWQQQWIAPRSPEAEISPNFGKTSNFTTWVDNGNLYVTFIVNMSSSVPDTQYQWNLAFTNNTWYEDYESSWGLHQVYAWEYEYWYTFDFLGTPVFVDAVYDNQLAYNFVNGTLGAAFMFGEEAPYIIIDDQKLPIDTVDIYDPWSQATRKQMLFFDGYIPEKDKEYWYYELVNGTKIPVTYADAIQIYNVTVAPGESFLTAQQWEYLWDVGGTTYYYWIDIYGNLHQSADWSYTRNGALNFTYYGYAEITDYTEHLFVRYGTNGILNISEYWWDSSAETYFMMDLDGNLYQLYYDSMYEQYRAIINGNWEYVSQPERFYIETFEGQDVLLVTWGIGRFWYFEDNNGVLHEMPYPGAGAVSDWDLNTLTSMGGKVPSTKSLIYNGTAYPVEHAVSYLYVVIDGITYEVDETYQACLIANGTVIWNPMQIGSSTEIGTYGSNFEFTATETVDYYWWDYDTPGGPYIHLINGTTWIVNYTQLVRIFAVDYKGYEFYSWSDNPWSETMGNVTTFWYIALNGTKIILDDYMVLPIINVTIVETYDDAGITKTDFGGMTYEVPTEQVWMFSTQKIYNATGTEQLYIPYGSSFAIYNFTYHEVEVTARSTKQAIRRLRYVWGHEYVYGPVPIESTIYRNFNELIIGSPEWGMWGLQNWGVDPSNGALDLDGDFDTTDDQYYVLEVYESQDSWTHTWDHMDVWLSWDPNGTAYGDEMHINSWMGVDTFTWTYSWNQSFFWYYADNFTLVSSTTMDNIRSTVLNDDGFPRAGYWDIAWMVNNVTWQDLLAEAQANGWDWISDEGQTWTWLSFGIDQNYGTSVQDGDVDHWLDVGLHYEFSGLMIWQDDDNNGVMSVDVTNPSDSELTHFLIPDSVDSIGFVTPGEAYGNFNDSDTMLLNVTDEVTWGVMFYNINGTVFPFTSYGYWGWYDSVVTGTDMRTFDERPTKVTIDELSFLVHFQGNITDTGLNNQATIKVDNYVGNWDVDLIGGRANLENRSLALNYFSEVRMSDFAFKANGSFADSESTVSSDTFELETAGARFAEMIMGGVTYDWGKNMTAPYDVLSYTTPLGTFKTAFESDNGKSATAWSFSSSMYMVSIGFPEWDGYSVYQDPVFVSYVSARGTSNVPGGVTFGAFSIDPEVPTSSDTVTVRVDIYSTETINDATLMYSVDGGMSWSYSNMWSESDTLFAGQIPPFDEGTEVLFKVGVNTQSGYYESMVNSYIVGQGLVNPTTTTTLPPYEGPTIGMDMLVMVAGVAVVVVVLGIIVARRRR